MDRWWVKPNRADTRSINQQSSDFVNCFVSVNYDNSNNNNNNEEPPNQQANTWSQWWSILLKAKSYHFSAKFMVKP